MNIDKISERQCICLVAMFILGNAVVTGADKSSMQDTWIAFTFAAAAIAPIMLMYARISILYPGKTLFDIVFDVFGKVFGWIITLIFFLYALQLSVLAMRNFTEFVNITVLRQTPQIIMALLLGIVVAYTLRKSISILGRASVIALTVVTVFIISTCLMLTGSFTLENLQPIFGAGANTITMGAVNIFAYPFGECVILISLLGAVREPSRKRRIMLVGLAFGFGLLMLGLLRNILALGGVTFSDLSFPSYVSASLINIGDFIHRVEIVIASSLAICVVIKLCLSLLVTCQAGAKLFCISDHKKIVYPVTLLTVILSAIVFKSIMEMSDWARLYPIYAIPVQVFLPLIIWLGAEIKSRKNPAISDGKTTG